MRLSVTDNWTLQDAVSLLIGREDPGREIAKIVVHDGHVALERVPRGAVQLRALSNLLSLLVLSDKIHLIGEWVDTWSGQVPALDSALGDQIRPVAGRENPGVAELRNAYQVTLDGSAPEVRIPRDHLLHSAVVRGTSVYLAIAEQQAATYTPHPQRARFLARTLWISSPRGPHDRKFESLIDESRVRLTRALVAEEEVVDSAQLWLPSIPLLCLRESSSATSPIAVALQLHRDNDVREFRSHMNELQDLLEKGEQEAYVREVAAFPHLIEHVEKSLGVTSLDESDGPATISVFGLPVRTPDRLRQTRFASRHSGFISRLLRTGTKDAREVISTALGIRDRRLLARIVAADV